MLLLLFNACAKHIDEDSIQLGTSVLNKLPGTAFTDEKLINSALDMLLKFGRVKQAEKLFRSANCRSLASWNILMQGDL